MNLFAKPSTKALFKSVAEEHDMVYFGHVDQRTDDHKLVRGVTLSPSHQDNHYCIGSIAGRDAIILERTDTVTHPNHAAAVYTWPIVSFDLKVTQLPHVVIDSGHHDKVFYEQFFTKFFQFMAADSGVFESHDVAFRKQFTVYAPPDVVDSLPVLLPESVTSTLAHHFPTLSFELFDDMLVVYTPQSRITKQLLDSMIHAGSWLAGELEVAASQLQRA